MGLVQRREQLSRETAREALAVLAALAGIQASDPDVLADIDALKRHWRVRYGKEDQLSRIVEKADAATEAQKTQAREALAAAG